MLDLNLLFVVFCAWLWTLLCFYASLSERARAEMREEWRMTGRAFRGAPPALFVLMGVGFLTPWLLSFVFG